MKRLIANNDNEIISEQVAAWCQYEMNSLDVNKAIQLNPDCLYSGTLYRAAGIENDWFLEDVLDIVEFPTTIYQLCEKVKSNCIIYDDNYSSFTKSINFAKEWNEIKNFQGTSVTYILKCNKEGFDINKFYEKHKDKIQNESMDIIEDCLYAEEVICKFDNDFEFYSLGDITDMNKIIESKEEAIEIFEI